MAEMEMPLPDNTEAMMTGQGPFGSVEMGVMFSILKVRADQPHGDYSDPGWYEHPEGTVAYEYTGELPEPDRFASGEKTASHNPRPTHTHERKTSVASESTSSPSAVEPQPNVAPTSPIETPQPESIEVVVRRPSSKVRVSYPRTMNPKTGEIFEIDVGRERTIASRAKF